MTPWIRRPEPEDEEEGDEKVKKKGLKERAALLI